MSVNIAIISGNLGADPEVRYLPNGDAICNFSVATSYDKEHTEWHYITAFKRTAEICGEYLSKGSFVTIVGYIRTRNWDDREGNKRFRTEIVAQRVDFIGKRKDKVNNQMNSQIPPEEDGIPF